MARRWYLQTNNLTLKYPGKMLCRNLSLTINPGECWAILGQNGCGKTTLIHALGGLHQRNRAILESPVTVAGKRLKPGPGASSHAISAFCCRKSRANSGEMCTNTYCWDGIRMSTALFGWQAVDHEIASRHRADGIDRPRPSLPGHAFRRRASTRAYRPVACPIATMLFAG